LLSGLLQTFGLSCATVSPVENPVPALVRAHVEAMEIVKPTLFEVFKYLECHDVWDIMDETVENTLDTQHIPPMIAALEAMNTAALEAGAKAEPFVTSTDEWVKTAGIQIQYVYAELIRNNTESIQQLKSFQENPGSDKALAELGYTIENKISGFTSGLSHTSSWVEEAILYHYPARKLRHYPKAERAEIVKRLENLYEAEPGKALTMYEGVHFCNAAVPLWERLK